MGGAETVITTNVHTRKACVLLKGTKDVIACEDTEQYLSKKIQVKLATGQLVNPNVIPRAPERVGGPRANTKSGASQMDCVRVVWEYAPRKFYML